MLAALAAPEGMRLDSQLCNPAGTCGEERNRERERVLENAEARSLRYGRSTRYL